MSKWLEERYILRSEHAEIVDYYRKLLVQLHVTVRELRDQLDERLLSVDLEGQGTPGRPTPLRSGIVDWSRYGSNVVGLDLHRVSRTKH